MRQGEYFTFNQIMLLKDLINEYAIESSSTGKAVEGFYFLKFKIDYINLPLSVERTANISVKLTFSKTDYEFFTLGSCKYDTGDELAFDITNVADTRSRKLRLSKNLVKVEIILSHNFDSRNISIFKNNDGSIMMKTSNLHDMTLSRNKERITQFKFDVPQEVMINITNMYKDDFIKIKSIGV